MKKLKQITGHISKRLGTKRDKKILAGIFGIGLSAIVVFSSLAPTAFASSTFTQTDWSGGVGTSTVNQYESVDKIDTSEPGRISVDKSTYDFTAWCNTANCDNSWTQRRPITLSNPGSTITDYSARFIIPDTYLMDDDFSDVRFINEAGDTELDYYLSRIIQNEEAYFWVNIPSLPNGDTKIYVYFGKTDPVSSLSDVNNGVVLFGDNFITNSVDTNIWDTSGLLPGLGEVVDGEIHHPVGIKSQSSFTAGSGKTVQYDYRFEDFACNKYGGNGLYFPFEISPYRRQMFQSIFDYDGDGCNNTDYKFYIENFTGGGNGIASPLFQQNETYTFRANWKADGSIDYYYSTDKGISFTQFDVSANVSPISNSIIGIGVDCCTYGDWFSNMTLTDTQPDIPYSIGEQITRGYYDGTLTSAVINMGPNPQFFDLNFTASGPNLISSPVRIRTSDNPDMSGASNWGDCTPLQNGANIISSGCVTQGETYLQYQVTITVNVAGNGYIEDISLNYLDDQLKPDNPTSVEIKQSSTGSIIQADSWTNDTTPYFSWNASSDDTGGSGLKGYCVYLGTSNTGDVITSSGVLPAYNNPNYNGINTDGQCQYATDQISLDISSFSSPINLQNGETYYLIIRAIDNVGNIADQTETATTSFKIDTAEPQFNTAFQAEGFTNTKEITFTWATVPGLTFFTDNESGPAGFKYCVTNVLLGFSGCDLSDQNWYGAAHTSGSIYDTSDVIPFSAGTHTLHPDDADRVDLNAGFTPGFNYVGIAAIDNAGNIFTGYGNYLVGQLGVVVTTITSGAPTNLQVTPSSSDSNAFSFSWQAPAINFGQMDYCWTVNEPIEVDASNCTWTGTGIIQLATGPYATQQGENTFYVMAKNQAGNFSNQEVASVTFTADTLAPGVPENPEIADVSTKATSNWKLGLSWSEPNTGAGSVSTYKIFRSTDNVNFGEVGSTSPDNLSFIDAGLSQVTYYYHIKACDSANSCSVASNVVSKLPTGRFTTPPSLTADTNQPRTDGTGTKRATIIWFTDRAGDSRVAYGTKPGQYFPAEISMPDQTTNHRVTLTNLEPGTTYYYVSKWTDEDGNTGISQERSFRTTDAPGVTDVTVSPITLDSATINFTSKDASKVRIEYGQSEAFGGSTEINTSSAVAQYSVRLNDLGDDTRYQYRISTLDSDGNVYPGDIRTFTTPPRPRIENLRFQPVEGSPSSTQKVTWTTNIAATSALTYGPRGGEQSETISSELTTSHEVVISGLLDDSDYTLVARSTDAAGNTAVSEAQSFRTALDTRPPKISDISVETSIKGSGGEAKGQVIVSWKTDELATSQVAYAEGQTQQLTSSTPEDGKLTTEHVVVLQGLDTASIYQIQPVSFDKSRNKSAGDIQTAITGRGTSSIFDIIFNAIERIFGL